MAEALAILAIKYNAFIDCIDGINCKVFVLI
jgi:hypothetical protein